MKAQLFILLLCISSISFSQTIAKEQTLEKLEFNGLLNSSEESMSLRQLKGKIVILEFWATWCGPCIPAMDHLIQLKETYGDKIEIIGITYDTKERIEKYINNKPSKIKFISDLDEYYKNIFPHNSIPHTIIIDKDGNLIAQTSPNELNEEVMKQLLLSNTFAGNSKVIQSRDGFDYSKDYFPVKKNENERFMLQPAIKNGFPMVKKFSKGEFKNRRVTFINSTIFNILKYIYDLNSDDQYRLEGVNMEYLQATTYCLDALVPENTDLKTFMQSKISEAFPDIKLKLINEKIEILELRKLPNQNLNLVKTTTNNQKSNNNITRVGNYDKSNVTLDDFTQDYLNKFITPILKKNIVNATGINGQYNIHFTFEIEDPKSFKRELNKVGLTLEPVIKDSEILIVSKY